MSVHRSVRGVVAANGGLTASTAYTAFGSPETTGGLMTYTPFGFAGGYTDSTGLIYLLHRYYDPTTGQFVTVDPMVQQTMQAYAYAGGNPVVRSDPSGLVDYTPAELQEMEALAVIDSAEMNSPVAPADVIAATTEVFSVAIQAGDTSLAQVQMFASDAAAAATSEANVTSSGAPPATQAQAILIDSAWALADATLANQSARAVGGNASALASEADSSAEQAVSDEGYQVTQIAKEGSPGVSGARIAQIAVATFVGGAASVFTGIASAGAYMAYAQGDIAPAEAGFAMIASLGPLAPALLAMGIMLWD